MSKFDPLHSLIKLFRSLLQLRNLRARKRERTPLKLLFPSRQKALTKRAENEWTGGYILTDDKDFIYIPKELDITTLERLTHEPAPEPIIAKVCPPGGTVMDVGANMGDWALPMAKAVGATGRVIAFEPVPYMADALAKTFQINGFSSSVVSLKALSDSIGEAAFTIAQKEGDLLNVRCSGLGIDLEGGHQTTVATTTLDAFCKEENIDRLDFIKIDVESHEAAVIQGGACAIERFQPAIVFEAGHWQETPEHRQIIHDTLAPLGYRVVGILIEHGLIETDWESYLAFKTPFRQPFFL
ncbi:MAG: FkbM family methyltransferase [Rhodospirillales bacterium]|nr:FkbM family methyltransferase [Rhodospirillales bacterium]